MKKLLALIVVPVVAAALIPGLALAAPGTGSEQIIELAIPVYGSELFSVSLPSSDVESGSGIEADPYIVRSSSLNVLVSLTGSGTITIKDNNGNILGTYTKVTNGPENIQIPVNLQNGVGIYQVTVIFASLDNPGNIFGNQTIFIDWRAFPIGPETPDTGYFYIGAQAIAVSAAVFDVTVLLLLTGISIFLCQRRKIAGQKK
jgi:hypothetical protein